MRRVFFDYRMANDAGEMRHAVLVLKELSRAHDFRIMSSEPQSIADGFEFWIDDPKQSKLPKYVRDLPA